MSPSICGNTYSGRYAVCRAAVLYLGCCLAKEAFNFFGIAQADKYYRGTDYVLVILPFCGSFPLLYESPVLLCAQHYPLIVTSLWSNNITIAIVGEASVLQNHSIGYCKGVSRDKSEFNSPCRAMCSDFAFFVSL